MLLYRRQHELFLFNADSNWVVLYCFRIRIFTKLFKIVNLYKLFSHISRQRTLLTPTSCTPLIKLINIYLNYFCYALAFVNQNNFF